MPYRSRGPRLYLRRARRDKEGEHAAIWIIRDGTNQQSTGSAAHDIAGAERALAKYLASKHARAARQTGSRDPEQIPIADVLTLYLTESFLAIRGRMKPKGASGAWKFLWRQDAVLRNWRDLPRLCSPTFDRCGSPP